MDDREMCWEPMGELWASDREAWAHERRGLSDYLRSQLQALKTGLRARWRRFRILEWVCGGCGETVIEVMATEPYLTLLTRRTFADRQSGTWGFTPLRSRSDAEELLMAVEAVCRCHHRHVLVTLVWDDLEAKVGKRSLPAPRRHDVPDDSSSAI